MPTNVKRSEGSNIEPIEAGTYIARCIGFIHIGTVEFEIQGVVQKANKGRFTFELPTELRVFKEDRGEEPRVISGEEPRVISKELTLSLNPKSNLYKFMKSWLGAEASEEWTPEEMVGVPAIIGVSTAEKGEKTYNDIMTCSKLPKGTECPPQINPSKIFNYDDHFDEKTVAEFPKFIQDKILSSEEWKTKKGITNPSVYKDDYDDINAIVP